MTQPPDLGAGRWLIVGHGSVGSALARRLLRAGIRPHVFDPAPRVALGPVTPVASIGGLPAFNWVVSCVSPAAAVALPATLRPVLGGDTLYLDWNTLPPEAKRQIAAAAPAGSVVDVALMDTLDQDADHPSLAVSGPQASRAAAVLRALGFAVDEVGATCGEAARLKLGRSLFMKGLEALLVEFRTALAPIAGRDIVLASLERNLGAQFATFAEKLIQTDRVHAARRAEELAGAVDLFAASPRDLALARAAVEVLRAAAQAWAGPGAPATGAEAEALVRHLAGLDHGGAHAAD